MQDERPIDSTPVPTPIRPSMRRTRSPVSQRELDFASSRALQQETKIVAEPQMPAVVDGLTGSPRMRPATKRVHSIDDLKKFLESSSAREFLQFILSLGEAVRGIKMTEEVEVSAPVHRLLDCLTRLSAWVDEIPPLEQTMRYGNVAFRDWHDRLEFSNQLVEGEITFFGWCLNFGIEILGDEWRFASVELTPYLYDSFGNKSRIDYGTGHETNFFAFLFCLAKLGLIVETDRVAVVTRVVKSYLDLMRKLQMTYGLEPAGSHGVWGLDDYQFLPFVLGAAQLINHPTLTPASLLDDSVVHAQESHFMLFGCVNFVRKVIFYLGFHQLNLELC